MKNKRIKYNGSLTHHNAILHMIGQSVDVFNSAPTVAEIADWMNVCKRTATKYLKRMQASGEIIMTKEPYKNTFRYRIALSDYFSWVCGSGMLEADYNVYAQRVMKVVLT